jgi:hypothetical protein
MISVNSVRRLALFLFLFSIVASNSLSAAIPVGGVVDPTVRAGIQACGIAVAKAAQPGTLELLRTWMGESPDPSAFSSKLADHLRGENIDVRKLLQAFYEAASKQGDGDLFSNQLSLLFGTPSSALSVLDYLSMAFDELPDSRDSSLQFAITRMASTHPQLYLILISEILKFNPDSYWDLREAITGVKGERPVTVAVAAPLGPSVFRRYRVHTVVSLVTAVVTAGLVVAFYEFRPEQTELNKNEVVLPPPNRLPVPATPAPIPKTEPVKPKPKPISVRDLRPGIYRLNPAGVPDVAAWLDKSKVTMSDHFFGDKLGKKVTLEAGLGQKVEYYFLAPDDVESHSPNDPRLPKDEQAPRAAQAGKLKVVSDSVFEIHPRAGKATDETKAPILKFELGKE